MSTTTEQTTIKNYTNYKVFGFWLAKSFKEQGIIDETAYAAWVKTQALYGSKETQDEFYGKFFESISTITQELKQMALAEKDINKETVKAAKLAEKEAAKAAKLAEKEAAKAAKLAEKEAAKAVKKEAAKAAKKEAAKAAKKEAVISANDVEVPPTRPSTPVIMEEISPEEIKEVSPDIQQETDKLMEGLLEEVLIESAIKPSSEEHVKSEEHVNSEEHVKESTKEEMPQQEINEGKGIDELIKEDYVDKVESIETPMDVVPYLEVTDSKKKKTMYVRRPVQINNILFADTDMKEQIKGFCVLADAKEGSDPIFQYQRGKKTK